MATRFAFDVDAEPEATTLHLRGELDLHSSVFLRSCLATIADSGEKHLVIDVRDLEFIDNAGIRAIGREARRIRERGGDVVVLGPRGATRAMFDLLGISQLVTIDDRSEPGPDSKASNF